MKRMHFLLILLTLSLGWPAMSEEKKILETASFGGGCFWCIETFFEKLKGVREVVSGYQGGKVENPSYQEVSSGRSGHAEVVQVVFDPREIRYVDLLEVFFQIHDPTTLNRQGNDVGTQYRSVIFTSNAEQKKEAEEAIARLTRDKVFPDPIVTEVVEAPKFYPAENYHQNYFAQNPNAPYCRLVIAPKLQKIRIRESLLQKKD